MQPRVTVGLKKDVVAFSYLSTHQGGPMQGRYRVAGDQRVLGQWQDV